jgi:hypothetical protein
MKEKFIQDAISNLISNCGRLDVLIERLDGNEEQKELKLTLERIKHSLEFSAQKLWKFPIE